MKNKSKKSKTNLIIRESKSLISLLFEASNLSAPEMRKKDRWDIFLEKMESETPGIFELQSGEEVTIPRGEPGTPNSDLEQALNDAISASSYDQTKDAISRYNLAFKDGVISIDVKSGKEIVITSPSDLKKDKDFGGRGSDSGRTAEKKQIDQINKAIAEASSETGFVDIKLGNDEIIEDVVKCEAMPGTPKADACLINSEDKQVAWISLKYADSPHEMNQWSGISKFKDDIEVLEFAEDIKTLGEVPVGKVVFRNVGEDSDLKVKAMWGTDEKKGKDLVNVIIATKKPIKLVKGADSAYSFSIDSGILLYHPEVPDDGWEPVLTGRRGDRSDLGVPNTRIGFFPKDYRKEDKRVELSSSNEEISLGETRLFLKELFLNRKM